MGKILALIALLLMSTSALAADNVAMGTSFASTGLSLYGAKSGVTIATPSTSPLIGKTSTGVAVSAKSATTGYAIWTQHKSGIKAYGSSFDSTSIFQATAVAGAPAVTGGAAPTQADSTMFTGVWTTM